MNNILEKYYPYVYYNDVKLSDIIKNLPCDINYFILVNYKYTTNKNEMMFGIYHRENSNYFKLLSGDYLYMTLDEFNRDISILEREAKLKEFFELID